MMNKEKHIMKECPRHGLTLYTWKNSEKRYRCKRCIHDAVHRRRYTIKAQAVEYKAGQREICGYDKCIDALEFHHLNPEEKDFGIGCKGYTRSWEKVKNELDKCIMICSNCHREIHAKEHEERKNLLLNK